MVVKIKSHAGGERKKIIIKAKTGCVNIRVSYLKVFQRGGQLQQAEEEAD